MTEEIPTNDPYREMKRTYRDPERVQRGPEMRFDPFLPFVSLAVTFSVMLGLNSVLDGEGVTRNALIVFLGVVAGALSLQANKAVFHIGSKLAAAGDRLALWLVLAWFVTMASVVGTIGFAGVSRDLIEGARLREPIEAISEASRRASEVSAHADGIAPLIAAGGTDLQSIASCEAQLGCVSGRPGRGQQVGALEVLAQKFKHVEGLYLRSNQKRGELALQLDGLAAKYEAQLSHGGATGESRAHLLGIYTQAQSLVTEIANAAPTAAAKGLATELRGLPVAPPVSGRIDVGARLRLHASRLEQGLETIAQTSIDLPPFPAPAGIAVGWQRLDLSWPLAILLFGLELILIVLWLLLVLDFRARRRSIDAFGDEQKMPVTSSELRSSNGRRGPAARHAEYGNGNGTGTGGRGEQL